MTPVIDVFPSYISFKDVVLIYCHFSAFETFFLAVLYQDDFIIFI